MGICLLCRSVVTAAAADAQAFMVLCQDLNRVIAAVRVELGGATEFDLEVGDAGDGISCDQSDWADAKVVLK